MPNKLPMDHLEKCKWPLWLLLVLFLLAAGTETRAFGQVSDVTLNAMERDAASNREAATMASSLPNAGMDFFSLLIKGGVFMIPIGVVSLMVLTFLFDRWIGLRFGRMLPSGFRKGLQQLLRQGDADPRALYRLCGEYPSPASNVVRSMVIKTGRPNPEIQSAVQEAMQREADRAHNNVRWLNLAAAIAPLLGLLGTVWGLIRAFHDTTQLTAGQNRADFLAVGIYEALVTTLAGLIVAIPAAVASHYFEGRITKIFAAIEELASEVLPALERYEGRTRFEPIGRELAARDMSIGPTHSPSMGSPTPSNVPRPLLKSDSRSRASKTPE
ncbi:MAG: MotA/TolQ/ExbB proton channel family protein [Pirellula sp.]